MLEYTKKGALIPTSPNRKAGKGEANRVIGFPECMNPKDQAWSLEEEFAGARKGSGVAQFYIGFKYLCVE